MADPILDALPPTHGTCLPLTRGGAMLAAWQAPAMTSISPFAGQTGAVSAALASAFGVGLGGAGQCAVSDGVEMLWMGRRLWFALGPATTQVASAVAGLAATTDQSDGWAGLTLTGSDAAAVLARLCPLDTDPGVFAAGATARTEVAHMMASVTPVATGFRLLVLRSFAGWAVHHTAAAMTSVATQRAIRTGWEMVPAPGLEPGTS